MSNAAKAEKYIHQCVSEVISVLEIHNCGLSIAGDGESLLISYEYKGDDGKDYIMSYKAFEIAKKEQ